MVASLYHVIALQYHVITSVSCDHLSIISQDHVITSLYHVTPHCIMCMASLTNFIMVLIELEPTILAHDVWLVCVHVHVDLTRDCPPGREEFFRNDGLSAVLQCVASGSDKLVMKALFLLEHCYTSGTEGNGTCMHAVFAPPHTFLVKYSILEKNFIHCTSVSWENKTWCGKYQSYPQVHEPFGQTYVQVYIWCDLQEWCESAFNI